MSGAGEEFWGLCPRCRGECIFQTSLGPVACGTCRGKGTLTVQPVPVLAPPPAAAVPPEEESSGMTGERYAGRVFSPNRRHPDAYVAAVFDRAHPRYPAPVFRPSGDPARDFRLVEELAPAPSRSAARAALRTRLAELNGGEAA